MQPDTEYTLTYYVGESALENDFVGYRVVLVADGLVITPTQDKPTPAPGQWVQATSTGFVGNDSEEVGYPISIVLEPLGGQVDFDAVDATTIPNAGPPIIPEPASMALFAIAAPLWGGRRRKSL